MDIDHLLHQFLSKSEEPVCMSVVAISLLMKMNDAQKLVSIMKEKETPTEVQFYIARFIIENRFSDYYQVTQELLHDAIDFKET